MTCFTSVFFFLALLIALLLQNIILYLFTTRLETFNEYYLSLSPSPSEALTSSNLFNCRHKSFKEFEICCFSLVFLC